MDFEHLLLLRLLIDKYVLALICDSSIRVRVLDLSVGSLLTTSVSRTGLFRAWLVSGVVCTIQSLRRFMSDRILIIALLLVLDHDRHISLTRMMVR